ncbi:uncharacterized protein LOC109608298 [Aethina tumida]|uniref:uncharacterized protein LOC109608298 n=1 Tax=Aethina tumida TaxID=116153 RepID=UPI00096B1F3B|nr:uncharacterized protein LOC109608298 [Aethina tumida]
MSVTDPLLKDVKGCVQIFLKENASQTKVTDNNSTTLDFLYTLEKIFNFGLITQQNTLYFNRTIDPFCWLSSIIKEKSEIITYTYINCVESTKEKAGLRNNTAKFRYLLKTCLVKKCLHVPVEFLMLSKKCHLFYLRNSVIGDEILSEIFLSVLLQLSKISFNLDLDICSFLDQTWRLPETLNFELVPCRTLGISVSFSGDRAVIVHIESSGVAAETEQIHKGDILDSLNGIYITASSKGRLNSILRSSKAKPVIMIIVKAYQTSTNDIFPPIAQLFKDLNFDVQSIKDQYKPVVNHQEDNAHIKKVYGFEVLYMGLIHIGEDGSVRQIEKAIKTFLGSRDRKNMDKTVLFEIGEIGVRLRDPETSDLIEQHTYMSISSCGASTYQKNYFGYIAGSKNEVCDQAENFVCHIFHSEHQGEISTILQSIGQGFHRTHFAV